MKSVSLGTSLPMGLIARVALQCALLALQIEIVEVAARRYFDPSNLGESIWLPLLDYRLHFFSFVVVFPAALLLVVWPRCRGHAEQFINEAAGHRWQPFMLLQLFAFGAFAVVTYSLSVHPEAYSGFSSLALTLWAMLLLAVGWFWLLSLAPAKYWLGLINDERGALAAAVVVAIFAASATVWLREVAPVLARGTLHGAHFLIERIYDPVVFDIASRRIGTPEFSVRVSNACAGYEGIVLTTLFLSVYLWLFRRDLRFPAVFLAFPIGIAAIWCFNVLRVALLIAIGNSYSAEVALAGFHSNAGWIAFLVVTLGLIALLHRVPVFTRREGQAGASVPSGRDNSAGGLVDALLLPFMALLASGLLLGALSAGFDTLYPVKVLATGAALWFFWQVYDFPNYRIYREPVLVGVAVFIVWMLLVAESPESTESYNAQFAEWSQAAVYIWLVFRCIGSVITVPLAEELAFRGYLLARLGGSKLSINGPLPFSLFACVVSSVLFGLLHSAWLAGILAGLAYAWVRYRRGKLGDAVVAHMTTNLLLSSYVLLTHQWSYW